MDFNPNNPVIKLCIQGMAFEEKQSVEEATDLFLQAWNAAVTDFDKYLAAYFVARIQTGLSEKLMWFEKSLQLALRIDNPAVQTAIPSLYLNISKCYDALGDVHNARKNDGLAKLNSDRSSDNGPFYHGTRADLNVGDFLLPGRQSNYHSEVIMNHVYFTAQVNGAGLAAALARGEGAERVYIVEPTGTFENDPNVTDKKFPGNPTRSYRTIHPLKVVGELTEWVKLTPEEIQKWKERLANNKGKIIN